MARLFLIAHASTHALEQARFPTDEPISERGRRELARATAPVVDRWLCAPEGRTVATARALGGAVRVETALRDLDYGIWAGSSMNEVPEAELAGWLSDPTVSPPDGEAITELLVRVGGWLTALPATPERIAVVTHPAVIRAVTVCALQAPASAFWRIDVRPLSITRFHGRPGRWTMRLC